MKGAEAGWFPDPVGRGDHRWWDGESWTDIVSVAGDERTDPEPPPTGSPFDPPPRPRQRTDWWLGGAAVVVACLVGLAAGVATGAAGAAPDYASALAGDLEARAHGRLTAGEAACVADGMVAELGEDRLRALELIGEPDQPWPLNELSDGERRTFATVSYGCIEQRHLAAHLADSWFPVMARTADDRTCVSQGYVNALPAVRMREILVALYTREAYEVHDLLDEDELAAVADIPEGCGL